MHQLNTTNEGEYFNSLNHTLEPRPQTFSIAETLYLDYCTEHNLDIASESEINRFCSFVLKNYSLIKL